MTESKPKIKEDDFSTLLKKILSARGIFIIYNYKTFIKTFPFIVSVIAMLAYLLLTYFFKLNHYENLKYFIEKFISIFPNLLGFSLGGFAIIVGFGNTAFLKRIAELTEKNEYSMYEKLNAIFAFNLLFQIATILFTLFFDFTLFLSSQIAIDLSARSVAVVNVTAICFLLLLGTWTLLVIPYLISNIFIFGESHHFILRNEAEKEKGTKDKAQD
ncbi:MAG: hypothetical protein JNJ41_16390 [Bacteroidia bacterium]|nr:hypothetical protein [Bacteroidia bacterium]